jgi:hypothetical protein
MTIRIATLVLVLTACSRAPVNQTETLERDFQQSLTNVTLVGNSVTDGRAGISGEERYVIEKVSHLAGEQWLFQTRIKYGGKEYPLPLPITIKWAGDTPVITLTELSIPKLGTYSARVVLYRGTYAGTWSGRDHGGQLWGKIVKNP